MANRVPVEIRLHAWPEHAAVARTMRYETLTYDDAKPHIEPLDTADRSARAYFKANKPIGKERFQQLDIGITWHEIDVLSPWHRA